jgi:hypothetical protein
MHPYRLSDFLFFERLQKKTGSAVFIPKRSKQIKNKRRKRGRK